MPVSTVNGQPFRRFARGQCQQGSLVLSSAAITGRCPVLTVTRDMILPTTVTGSYPRPL